MLERGRYPRGVVYLELPPELLDVNVLIALFDVTHVHHEAAHDRDIARLRRTAPMQQSLRLKWIHRTFPTMQTVPPPTARTL